MELLKGWGDTRYKELTDNFAGEFMVAIDSTESVDELYDWYLKRMNDIKMEAYGKSTVSIKRAEKIDDDKMWHKRLSEIRKSVSTLGKRKITDKIWALKAKTSNKYTDRQFVSVVNPKDGSLTKTRKETFSVMLDYNEQLMNKNKVVKDKELEDSDALKDILIQFGMNSQESEQDKEITSTEFYQVLTKIRLSGKSIYRDLVKAGPLFQSAYHHWMNRMYSPAQ